MTHYTPYSNRYINDAPRPRSAAGVPGWRRMVAIIFLVAVIVSLLLLVKPTPAAGPAPTPVAGTEAAAPPAPKPAGSAPAEGSIAPFFSPEVRQWAPAITKWAEAYGLDPNAVATIMQIESCGDPRAVSSAGARGLFQVMPFHFTAGEDPFDPETNARRGLAYFVERLQQTGADVGRAFAGYNGGQRGPRPAPGSSGRPRRSAITCGARGSIRTPAAARTPAQRWKRGWRPAGPASAAKRPHGWG